MLLLFVLLLSGYGIRSDHASPIHGYSSDMLSLLDFKRAITKDPKGALASWNSSTHFCMWKGVFCSRKHPGRVAALELSSQYLFKVKSAPLSET
ncbi:hypothetical protein EJB05_20835, partial [Eragrostis curvula]